MACNCFAEVKERMEVRVKEVLGDSVHSMDECDFGSRVWVLEKGDYCAVMLPFNVRYPLCHLKNTTARCTSGLRGRLCALSRLANMTGRRKYGPKPTGNLATQLTSSGVITELTSASCRTSAVNVKRWKNDPH